MKRPLFAAIAFAVALLVQIVWVAPANATYYSGGMPTASFKVRIVWSSNAGENNIFRAAVDSWNQTASPANLTIAAPAPGDVAIGNYATDWYGLYTPYNSRANRTFDIKLNRTTLQADSGTNYSNWLWSSTAHELGHALSLADNPSTSSASLMKHNRNRTLIYKPQPYDIADVNAIY